MALKILLLIFSCATGYLGKAQSLPNQFGSSSHAMGNSASTNSNAFSSLNNVASSAFIEQNAFGVQVQQLFTKSPIDLLAIGYIQKHHSSAITLGMAYFGVPIYKELRIAGGYAVQLTPSFSIGGRLEYLRQSANFYDAKVLWTASVGVFYYVNPKCVLAMHSFNPLGIESTTFPDQTSAYYAIGTAIQTHPKALLTAEIDKNVRTAVRYKIGLQYELKPKIFLRIGQQLQPSMLTFGIGVNTNTWQISGGSSLHPALGISPSFSATR